jgi:hypothetical protein
MADKHDDLIQAALLRVMHIVERRSHLRPFAGATTPPARSRLLDMFTSVLILLVVAGVVLRVAVSSPTGSDPFPDRHTTRQTLYVRGSLVSERS